MTFIIFIDNAGFKYTPSPHKIARGGTQPPRIKNIRPATARPASENLIQARGSPRAAGARAGRPSPCRGLLVIQYQPRCC